jgi:hypothetical protein
MAPDLRGEITMKIETVIRIVSVIAAFCLMACQERPRGVNIEGNGKEDQTLPGQKSGEPFDGSQEKIVPGSRH